MAQPDIKRLAISDFRERGYLHEVNRLLLHPLGLALEVSVATVPSCRITVPVDALDELQRLLDEIIERGRSGMHVENATAIKDAIARGMWFNGGDEALGGVWDCREDPEGVYYGDDLLDVDKARAVFGDIMSRRAARRERLGYVIQPVPGEKVLTTNYTDPDPPTQEVDGIGEVEFER